LILLFRIQSLKKFEVIGGVVSGTEESRGKISLDRPNRQWDYPYVSLPVRSTNIDESLLQICMVRCDLMYCGSVLTITLDRPPHQIMTWVGLERYGYLEEAQRLAYRFLYMMTTAFVDFNGVVPEKVRPTSQDNRLLNSGPV